MSKLVTMMNELTGTKNQPKYQIGYHKADNTVHGVAEVSTLMEVIDTVSSKFEGPDYGNG